MDILIISSSIDLATDRVIDIFRSKGISIYRLNTENLPYKQSISLHYKENFEEEFRISDIPLNQLLRNVKSIWYRRIRSPYCPDNCDTGIHQYVVNETYSAIKGMLLTAFDNCRWMSYPLNIDKAELKPYQLKVARDIGLKIPHTLISSEPSQIRNFFSINEGSVIAKPIRSGYVECSEGCFAIYTENLDRKLVELLDTSLSCPIIIQKKIKKQFDIRVTVVGKQIFSVAIDSKIDPDATVDWRRTNLKNIPHEKHKLPDFIEIRLLNLMKAFNLNFAAIDFVLDKDGNYIFLEINPNGQWLWVEDKLNLPISEAIVNWLLGKKEIE
jgi:glutathione synthase/RimK-type ligase-like ATP-grasp enzyme